MATLFHCSVCGAVYYLGANMDPLPCHCPGATMLEIEITARSANYSEAGGDVTGIDTFIDIH